MDRDTSSCPSVGCVCRGRPSYGGTKRNLRERDEKIRDQPIKSDVNTLDFAVRRFLIKLFKTVNNDVIQDCCNFLKFSLPSDILAV